MLTVTPRAVRSVTLFSNCERERAIRSALGTTNVSPIVITSRDSNVFNYCYSFFVSLIVIVSTATKVTNTSLIEFKRSNEVKLMLEKFNVLKIT